MAKVTLPFRFSAATGLHRGDRAYQQDQVELIRHARSKGAVLAVVADGMGGKSGGRKASDQVLLTARQIFERFAPGVDDASDMLRQLVLEAHLMIKLTAITSEEEPDSTVAAFLKESATELRRAVQLDGSSVEAWFELGRSLHRLRRLREAGEALREALSLDASDPRVHYLLGRICYEQGDRECGDEHMRLSESRRGH